jgi:hypothetical protein
MAFLKRRSGFVALALLLASAAWAQAPNQRTIVPDRPKLRQPTPSSVLPPEASPEAESGSPSEAERKIQEADRRMNRVLRSICNGC